MNRDLISIIVPVYGVEKYLNACVDSILAQTYQNLEVILIDDGSLDNCGAICDSYAVRDSRVKVIHKTNGGAASARNKGLDAAKGEYTCLIDSDDWVSPDFVEKLSQKLTQTGADVSVCSFVNVFCNGDTPNPMTYPDHETMTQVQFLERFLTDWTSGMATNKMFKSSLLRTVRYAEGHKIDDEFFTYQAIMNAQRVVMFDEPLYFYRMRGSSVMASAGQYPERMLWDRLEYLELRYAQICGRYPELAWKFFRNLALNLVQFRVQGWHNKTFMRELRKRMWHHLPRVLCSAMSVREKYGYIHALALSDSHCAHTEQQTAAENGLIWFE